MTRSARLKQAHAHAVLAGPEAMSIFRAAHTEAMIRYGRPLSPDEEARVRAKAQKLAEGTLRREDPSTPTKQHLPVRLNRAQQLRLEEQERERARLAAQQAASERDKSHLSHVEARIDFGRGKSDGASSRMEDRTAGQTPDPAMEERQRILAEEVDEVEWGYEIVPVQAEVGDDSQGVSGTPLSAMCSGVEVKELGRRPNHRLMRVLLVAASEDDTRLEREILVDEVMPNVREYARTLGLEVQLVDLGWGWTKKMEDEHVVQDLMFKEAVRCAGSSIAVDAIVLLTNKRGHIFSLPESIPQDVFDILFKAVEHIQQPPLQLSENVDSEPVPGNRADLVNLLYKLDSNVLPQAQYILRKISDVVKGVNSDDEDLRSSSLTRWKELASQAHETFALATHHLLHDTDEGPGDDILELLDKLFLKSTYERLIDDVLRVEEVVFEGHSEERMVARGLVVKRRMIDFNGSRNSGPERRHVDWVKGVGGEEASGEEYVVDTKAQEDLAKVGTRLLNLWGEDRVVETEVRWQPSGLQPKLYPSQQAYLQMFQDAVTSRLTTILESTFEEAAVVPAITASPSASLHPATSEQRVYEEVTHHLRLFGNVTGILRRDDVGLDYTPFVGRREEVEKLRRVLADSEEEGSDVRPPVFVCGATGTGKKVFVCWVLRRCIQSGRGMGLDGTERPKESGDGNDLATTDDASDRSEPVIIIRFVGTTPESSTSSGIMASMCRQIRTAFSDQDSHARKSAPFQPLANPSTAPKDYSTLCAYFRNTLQLATSDRRIVMVLLGLDKLSDWEQGRLGWLPIENMPRHISLVCTLSAPETTPTNLLLDSLLPRLKNAYKLLSDDRSPIDDALSSLASQNGIITVESFTLRDASVALRRWLGRRQRKLHPAQRSIMLERCAAENKMVNPLLWKSVVARTVRWGVNAGDKEETISAETASAIESGGLSSDSPAAMDSLFDLLESRHGRQLVCQTCRYICGLRDGIAEHELFDLLSTDRTVLSEVYSRLGSGALGKGAGNRPFSLTARIPPVVFADLLHSFIEDWDVLVRFSQGSYGGHIVIRFSHALYEVAARRRYVTDKEMRNTQNDLASYFMFGNGEESATTTKQADIIHLEDGSAVPLRGLTKRFPPQDVNFAGSILDPPIYNVRKVREAPYLLVATQRWAELKDLLEDYYFTEALLVAEGIYQTISTLFQLLQTGRKNSPTMPNNLAFLLRAMIAFFRQRQWWMSWYGNARGDLMPALWHQECVNGFLQLEGLGEEGLRDFVKENRLNLEKFRGGRLEYLDSWKPDPPTPNQFCPSYYHNQLLCSALSHDGTKLATGACDGSIKVYDMASGEELLTLFHGATSASSSDKRRESRPVTKGSETSHVTAVAFSRSGTYLISAAGGSTNLLRSSNASPSSVRVWNLKTGLAEKTLNGGHPSGGRIRFISYAGAEERRIISGCSDGSVVVWELARAKVIRTFSPKGCEAPSDGDGSNPWDSNIGGMIRERMFAGAVSESGMIAYGSKHLTVLDGRWKELWTCDLSVPSSVVAGKSQQLSAAVFSPDSETLYTATYVPDAEAERILVQLGIELKNLKERAAVPAEAAGEPTDSPSPSSNKEYDLAASIAQLEEQARRVRCSVVRAWNVHTGQTRYVVNTEDRITTFAVTQDGSLLVTAGEQGMVVARRASSGEMVYVKESCPKSIRQAMPIPRTTERGGRKQLAVPVVANSVDSSTVRVLVSGYDDFVTVCALETANEHHGSQPITSCSFSTNGAYLLTIGGGLVKDGTQKTAVQLWDVETGLVRYRLDVGAESQHQPEVVFASWMPTDSSKVVVGCSNGLVTVFAIPPAASGAIARPGIIDATVMKEFWVDAGLSWVGDNKRTENSPENGGATWESPIGWWPFAATGCQVIGYALHHKFDIMAVAFCGKQRFESSRPPSKLQNIVHMAFWSLSGAPCKTVASEHSTISYDPDRGASPDDFAMQWDSESGLLYVSDNLEVWRCCKVYIDEEPAESGFLTKPPQYRVNVSLDSLWTDRRRMDPPPLGPATCGTITKITGSNRYLAMSRPGSSLSRMGSSVAAPAIDAFSQPQAGPTFIHTTFAYGNGVVCDIVVDVESKEKKVMQLMGHSEGLAAGKVVGCAYVPWCGALKRGPGAEGSGTDSEEGSGGEKESRWHHRGVVVSVGKDGLVLVQNYHAQTVNAIFHAHQPLHGLATCPRTTAELQKGEFKFALCGANGFVAVVKYCP
ncbi:hypothetical protein HK097_006306 [Rhizophlyctis rosea]|uniref:NWD1/2-like winged helix-turn-helix domain-containing protein n=1 Tax=Rhizophlyctis rosea TaxID=64517 RepID=A0AAD5SEW3_9FUNG|nr:hypothetical protein HK097_006306 [Rhizophlyctis rosea]